MTDNLGIWAGEFGKEYTDRNQYDPALRVDGFSKLLPADAQHILEAGCNYGNNLESIERLGKTAIGIEPNDYAREKGQKLKRKILPGNIYSLPFPTASFDLVMTCGVLIHVPPEKIDEAMAEMYRVARRYLLVIEYMGEDTAIIDKTTGMKEYRGKLDMLWKRPTYDWHLAKLIGSGELGPEWDHASWRLFEK